ncbi:MAG: monofunctional biosynthetic peptidoglycan transglycosylase [Candidatus Kapabacteria bacterium]|nr:monofunctional biosynthetic peptidoglycan transglycosylase [Candidatus Kapabacteria bacterium]
MGKFFKIIIYCCLLFMIFSVGIVFIYKYVNPPMTPTMLIRAVEAIKEGRLQFIERQWVDYDEVSPNLIRAIIAAEDARFMTHFGIDWKAVKDSQTYNKRHKGKKKRGASTVTMQTAKNTFLNHSRNYVRKAFEAYFTYLIEAIWDKKRIIEVYVNVVEWGDGVYGAEAASKKFFGKSAIDLSRREAALLASVLPNPHRWSPAKPTNYINKRVGWISGRMNSVQIPS